jgi:hypothetical protein
MPHPLVTQLRFTRSELVRGLRKVTPEEAARRFGPINPIAWMIGHLAWQEQLYWLERAQDTVAVPEVKAFGYGKRLSVPPLEEVSGRAPAARSHGPAHLRGRLRQGAVPSGALTRPAIAS